MAGNYACYATTLSFQTLYIFFSFKEIKSEVNNAAGLISCLNHSQMLHDKERTFYLFMLLVETQGCSLSKF